MQHEKLLKRLKRRFPDLFYRGLEIKPLAVGIAKQIFNELRKDNSSITLEQVRKDLSKVTSMPRYLKRIVTGGCRYNIYGSIEGYIQPKEINYSKRILEGYTLSKQRHLQKQFDDIYSKLMQKRIKDGIIAGVDTQVLYMAFYKRPEIKDVMEGYKLNQLYKCDFDLQRSVSDLGQLTEKLFTKLITDYPGFEVDQTFYYCYLVDKNFYRYSVKFVGDKLLCERD